MKKMHPSDFRIMVDTVADIGCVYVAWRDNPYSRFSIDIDAVENHTHESILEQIAANAKNAEPLREMLGDDSDVFLEIYGNRDLVRKVARKIETISEYVQMREARDRLDEKRDELVEMLKDANLSTDAAFTLLESIPIFRACHENEEYVPNTYVYTDKIVHADRPEDDIKNWVRNILVVEAEVYSVFDFADSNNFSRADNERTLDFVLRYPDAVSVQSREASVYDVVGMTPDCLAARLCPEDRSFPAP